MEIVNEHVLGLIGRQQTSSEIDYVDSNGVLHRGANAGIVQINSAAELDELPEDLYAPGTIAYTPGMGFLWQKNSDGEWIPSSVAKMDVSIHICSAQEYDSTTRIPTVTDPDPSTFYLVPAENGTSPDLFVEWAYVNNAWEMFGSASVDLSGLITDVKVNGTSVVTDGVANVPVASSSALGVVTVSDDDYGIGFYGNGRLVTKGALPAQIKGGSNGYKPITPSTQDSSVFYGLAKAAGDTTQKNSANAVGTYTPAAKSAISTMLTAPESVTGTTPTITALAGVQYVCGEVATLDITLPASGCVDVRFESGSTPTVLTITPPTGVTLKWAGGFDPTALEANTIYEINIADGLGVSASWT